MVAAICAVEVVGVLWTDESYSKKPAFFRMPAQWFGEVYAAFESGIDSP